MAVGMGVYTGAHASVRGEAAVDQHIDSCGWNECGGAVAARHESMHAKTETFLEFAYVCT